MNYHALCIAARARVQPIALRSQFREGTRMIEVNTMLTLESADRICKGFGNQQDASFCEINVISSRLPTKHVEMIDDS